MLPSTLNPQRAALIAPSSTKLRALFFRSFPSLSAAFLADRFLVPWTRLPGLTGETPLESIAIEGGRGVLQMRGKGPLIVLSHGWAGSGRQFTSLGNKLVDAGFRVALFDAPAHGSARGRSTNAHEFARMITAIAQRHGPIAGIVGHSLGGLASAMACERVHPSALALLAPMPSFEFALQSYQTALGFDDAMRERIARIVEQRAGTTRAQSQVEHALSGRRVLIVHDRGDRRIPVEASRDLASRFPELEYLETDGLGHSRLLGEDRVHARIVQFLRDAMRAKA